MARGRRDRYGRYRGAGGIKPWKSNNPNFGGYRPRYVRKGSGKHNATSGYKPKGIAPQKKSSAKKKILIGAVVVGAAAGGAYGVHKYRQKRAATALGTTGANTAPVPSGKRSRIVAKGTRLRPGAPVETPRLSPIRITPPKSINAKTLLTTAAAASTAARVSTEVSPDDRAANESKDKWVRIERARQAGIPKAADFIANGGTDAEIRAAERKGSTKIVPTIKPSVIREAPVHTEKQQAAKVEKAKVNFRPVAAGIAIATPRQLGMTNENGNPIRIFPQTRLNRRPSSIASRKQKEAELNRQFGRAQAPKPPTVKNLAQPKPVKSPESVAGKEIKKPTTNSSPQKRAAAPVQKATSAISKKPAVANTAAYSKERTKTFEQMSLEEQAAFLRGDARSKNNKRPLGGARAQQRFADFDIKHVSQARIHDGGKYQDTFEEAPARKPKKRSR